CVDDVRKDAAHSTLVMGLHGVRKRNELKSAEIEIAGKGISSDSVHKWATPPIRFAFCPVPFMGSRLGPSQFEQPTWKLHHWPFAKHPACVCRPPNDVRTVRANLDT